MVPLAMTVSTPVELLIRSPPDEDGMKHWNEVPLRVNSTTGMIIPPPVLDATNGGGTSE